MLASSAARQRFSARAASSLAQLTCCFGFFWAPRCGSLAPSAFAAHGFATPAQTRASRLPLSRVAVAELNFAH
nr:MAG: MC017.1L [Molluscum contagiosum virus]